MYVFLRTKFCSFLGSRSGNKSELLNGKRDKSRSYFSETVISWVQEEIFDLFHLCIIFNRSCSPCSSNQSLFLSTRTSARSDQICLTKYLTCSCQTCLIEIGKISLILRDHMLWFKLVGNPIFDRIHSE
jgi:hypothetical protein